MGGKETTDKHEGKNQDCEGGCWNSEKNGILKENVGEKQRKWDSAQQA